MRFEIFKDNTDRNNFLDLLGMLWKKWMESRRISLSAKLGENIVQFNSIIVLFLIETAKLKSPLAYYEFKLSF
jgi:hypothetical protein